MRILFVEDDAEIAGRFITRLSAIGFNVEHAPNAEIALNHVPAGQAIRLGGMVVDKSIQRQSDGVTVNFVVKDESETIPVTFKGITPDLFKENSGVIAEGAMTPNGLFVATNLLAKHDEKYMPPKLSGSMHKTGVVAK